MGEPRNLGEPLRYITVSPPRQTRCHSAPVSHIPSFPIRATESNTLGSPQKQVEVLRPTMHNYTSGAAVGQHILTDAATSPIGRLHEPRVLTGFTQQEPVAVPVERSQSEFAGNFPAVAVVARPQQARVASGTSFSQQQAETANWMPPPALVTENMPTVPTLEAFQSGYAMVSTLASQVGVMEPALRQQGICAPREQYCGAGLPMPAPAMAADPDLAHHAHPNTSRGGSAEVGCASCAASEPVQQNIGADLSTSQLVSFPPLDLGQCSRSIPCPSSGSATPPVGSGRRTLTTGPAKIMRVVESSPHGMVEARPSDLADTRRGSAELKTSSEAGCAALLFPRHETDRAVCDSWDGIQGSSSGDANKT